MHFCEANLRIRKGNVRGGKGNLRDCGGNTRFDGGDECFAKGKKPFTVFRWLFARKNKFSRLSFIFLQSNLMFLI